MKCDNQEISFADQNLFLNDNFVQNIYKPKLVYMYIYFIY